MKIILTGILFLFVRACFGQGEVFKQYTVEDGLPSPIVYASIQDNEGYMWFATDNGLCRFDGFEFVQYTSNEGLPDNEVLELWVDKNGRLWIGCYNSAPAYYENGTIYNDKNTPLLKGLPKSNVYRTFYEDAENNLWIAGADYVIRMNSDTVAGIYDIALYRGRGVLFFYERNNQLYLEDVSRRYLFEQDSFKLISTYDSVYENEIIFFNKTLATDSFVYYYHVRGNVYKVPIYNGVETSRRKLIDFPYNINHIAKDNISNRLILGTDQGVYYTDSTTQVYKQLLAGTIISTVRFDNFGNAWFTTFGNGVYMLQNKRINTIRLNDENMEEVAYAITGFGNRLIMAGSETGNYYEIAGGEIKMKKQLFTNTGFGRKILSINDFGDDLLMATASGIVKLNKSTYAPTYFSKPGPVKTIAVHGDQVFCGATSTSSIWDINLQQYRMIFEKRSIASCYDKNGLLWIGTLKELLTYDGTVIDTAAWYDFNLYGRLSSISVLKDNTLVIGSYNSGVVIRGKNQIHNISVRNGLSGNLCRYMYVDENDHIWVCTNGGLNKIVYNKEKDAVESVTVFDETDGLLSNSVYSVYAYNDTVWVSSEKGISWFYANREMEKHTIPTYITGLKANDRQWYNLDSLPVLNHAQNQILINFTSISFINKKNIKYAYRLVGSDDEWNFTNQRAVLYNKLKPGKYTFEVYAFDTEGNRNDKTATLSFTIQPAFWQTLWFTVAVIFFTATLILLAVLYWVRNIRHKEKEKSTLDKQFSELKLESIRAQLNPHFIFNALNSVQTFNIKHDDKQAQKYLADFSKLMRTTLNFAKQDFISVSDEIDYLQNYLSLEKLRYREQFVYHIDATGLTNPQDLLIPTQIIQPYVENAIHHGIKMLQERQGVFDLIFRLDNNSLICMIEDNGIGIKKSMSLKSPSKAHQSVGMKLAINNIEIINKLHGIHIQMTINDRSDLPGAAEGTVVTIIFPVKTATHD